MKRIFDLFAAFSLLLIFAIPLGILFIMVGFSLGRPIFFKQIRPGLNGKPFQMIKIRTMINLNDQYGNLLSDADRLTKFGRFLRATSIDELPELWNVFKGDMSLVGPRPLLMEYLTLYSDEQARRHEVRPGITGWAQVNGRNAIGWEERFKLDVWYVDNYSFWLDLKILWLTVIKVTKRHGISAQGEATMTPFKGSRKKNRVEIN